MKKLLWILLLVSVSGLGARATPLDDKVKAFNDALREAAPASPAGNSDPMYAERLAQQFNMSEQPGGEANLEPMIRQLMATNPSKAVQAAGEALLEELRAEKKARLDALTAKIDAVLDGLPAAVAKATKPADLDSVLNDIQGVTPANGGGYGYDPESQVPIQRANAAYQVVSQWQDYLSYLANGNNQEALNALRNLLNNRPNGPSIVPRSDILALIAPLDAKSRAQATGAMYSPPHQPDIGPIIDGIKTLDDLDPAARKVAATFGNMQNQDTGQLGQFAFLYGQAKNGLGVSLDLSPQNMMINAPPPGFARIESMLLLYLLPRFLGPTAPALNPNEQVSDYLQRVESTAESTQDWPLLQRVLIAEIKIARVQPPQGTQNFIAGLNQEMAGQYVQAVAAYQNALGMPDNFVSGKLVGDRLDAIKKDHPAEYAEAAKNAQHPPMPNYPAYPGAYYGFNPYQARLGFPGANPGAGAPAVPAANPARTNTAPAMATTNAPPAGAAPAAK